MNRTLLILALSAAPVSAQVLCPVPSVPAFDIEWRADIYHRDHAPILNALLVDFDRANEPPFGTMRECREYGTGHAADMTSLVAAYMDADVVVRFTCTAQTAEKPASVRKRVPKR